MPKLALNDSKLGHSIVASRLLLAFKDIQKEMSHLGITSASPQFHIGSTSISLRQPLPILKLLGHFC